MTSASTVTMALVHLCNKVHRETRRAAVVSANRVRSAVI